MDPFTIALATFGVQKLRGKSTRTALKDAALLGGASFGIGQLAQAGALGSQAQAGQGFLGNIGRGKAFSSIPGLGDSEILAKVKGQKGDKDLYKTFLDAAKDKGLDTAEGKELLKAANEYKPSGIAGMSTIGKVASAAALTPLLMGEEEPVKPLFDEDDYKQAYKEQSEKLKGAFEPVKMTKPTIAEVSPPMFYANQGGLATALPKYNEGGVNYLPSKIDHDENDVNNYVRASGYVEDGAGVGNKDEDTMLAQLADGEFVSRADAVLGAGILSGADPKSFKGMRKAGADFFYNQQKQFKRIYDLVDGSKENKN
tara:strand:+ start:7 stop:945 length:939 start_codon:yes stop_codon:yes gene_type:complete